MACHVTREQRALLRVVRAPGGEIHVDAAGRANGRGAYVCRDPECISAATRRDALARALAATIPTSLVTELAAELAAQLAVADVDTTIAGGTLGQE